MRERVSEQEVKEGHYERTGRAVLSTAVIRVIPSGLSRRGAIG